MATDLKQMINNLLNFYNFNNKTVIAIGAGGGHFYEYALETKHVIAVDIDSEGIEKLKKSLVNEGILNKFTLVHSNFYDFKVEKELLMFDYCLHEIENTKRAVKHAFSMSYEVLINDHWPGSEWAYIVDEEIKVKKSWKALEDINIHRFERYNTFQFFHDYDELYTKVKAQGEKSIKRIEKYKDMKDIVIPMSYGLALIRRIDNELI